MLVRISHPDLLEDIYLSSDDKDIFSYDPYIRGTRSDWLGEEREFLFITMGIDLPDDKTDSLMQSSLVLEVLDSEIAAILTSTIEPATVDMALVMRSSPDFVERKFMGLEMEGADGDGGSISLSSSRQNVLSEPCPCDRMTKERFPGLHP
ncbi:hypothetical protein ASG50_25585 [Rhizobium sp. Leaf386]|nr:hypothetical protein ASG50_25585 [Rhizobium sp. Leaf386]